jgi:TetR/AcrR family transcriptional repressor of nem operon
MGRKLHFSRDEALQVAMNNFWAKGYSDTSMRDLAKQLNLHLGSLYNAFGDKEAIFEAALKVNHEQEVLPKFKALAISPEPLKAISDLVTSVMEECIGASPAPGCFLVNSLSEIACINDNISKAMQSYIAEIEDAVTCSIEKAQLSGQINSIYDARKYAQFVIAMMLSMRAMAKLKLQDSFLRDVRDVTISALRIEK